MKKWICLLLILSLITVGVAQETEIDDRFASDFNADGIINILDLTFVAVHYGETPSVDQYPTPDVNRDGIVDTLDLIHVADHFGKFSGIPLTITDKTFDNVVLTAKLPILVEFHSESCIYCWLMRPIVGVIAFEYRDIFGIAKLEVNQNPEIAEMYHITGTPTYILFHQGNIVETILGAMSKDRFLERIIAGLSAVIKPPLTQEQTDSE